MYFFKYKFFFLLITSKLTSNNKDYIHLTVENFSIAEERVFFFKYLLNIVKIQSLKLNFSRQFSIHR